MNVNNYIVNNNIQNLDFINVTPENNRRVTRSDFENEIIMNLNIVIKKNKNVKSDMNIIIMRNLLFIIDITKISSRKNKNK